MWTVSTNMPGYLPETDAEPFEADAEEAIEALLDEAERQLDDECCEGGDDCVTCSDRAFIESLRSAEGRADLRAALAERGDAAIWLESYANSFGGYVVLATA